MPKAEKPNFEWQTVTCPQCDGFGARNRPLVGEVECDRCDGGGEIQQKRKVDQPLTLGVRANEAITLLYTHGLLTGAMRDHARKKLVSL